MHCRLCGGLGILCWQQRVGLVLAHYPSEKRQLRSGQPAVWRGAGTRVSSFAVLVVGRQANAGASLGFGDIGGVHFISQNLKNFASFAYNIFNFSGQYSLEWLVFA